MSVDSVTKKTISSTTVPLSSEHRKNKKTRKEKPTGTLIKLKIWAMQAT
jgi:hypothetical protein